MGLGKHIAIAIVAVVAVLLQIIVAPYIAISAAVPDIIAVAAVLIAVVRGEKYGCAIAFVLGLLYDLFSGGPVGPMAFILVLVTYLAARLYVAINNDAPIMPILVAAISLLVIEVAYGIFLSILGYEGGVVGLVVYRALPVFLYDLVLAIVLYLPVKRLLAESAPIQSSITRLR